MSDKETWWEKDLQYDALLYDSRYRNRVKFIWRAVEFRMCKESLIPAMTGGIMEFDYKKDRDKFVKDKRSKK